MLNTIKTIIKKNFLTWEFCKYSIVGIFNTFIHFAVFFLLTNYDFSQLFSNITAFLLASLFSCLANTYWSFKRSLNFKIGYRFFTVTLAGFIVVYIFSAIADYYRINRIITILSVFSVLSVINFLIHKFWTYAQSKYRIK
jgi:putative flippase GtrA